MPRDVRGAGGGLSAILGAEVTVEGSHILDNALASGGALVGSGGGCSARLLASVIIARSTVARNSAASGGGLYVAESASLHLTDTVVEESVASTAGAGLNMVQVRGITWSKSPDWLVGSQRMLSLGSLGGEESY